MRRAARSCSLFFAMLLTCLASLLCAHAYAQRVSIPSTIDFEVLDGATLEGECSAYFARGARSACLLTPTLRTGAIREGYVQLVVAHGWHEPHERVRGSISVTTFAKPVAGANCPARLSIVVFPGAALAVNDSTNQVDRIALLASDGPSCEPLPWWEPHQ